MPANPVVPVEKMFWTVIVYPLSNSGGDIRNTNFRRAADFKKVEVIENHFKALSLELDRIDATYAPNRPLNVTKPDAKKSVPKSESVKITKVTTPIEKPTPKPPEKKSLHRLQL